MYGSGEEGQWYDMCTYNTLIKKWKKKDSGQVKWNLCHYKLSDMTPPGKCEGFCEINSLYKIKKKENIENINLTHSWI